MNYKFSILTIILASITLFSCKTEETVNAPIAFEKMQNILIDMHIAEYKSQGVGDKVNTLLKQEDSLALYYASIFEHHQIDSAQFRIALNWYMVNPKLFDSLYKNVTNYLDTALTHIKEQYPEYNNSTNDSKKLDQMIQNLESTDALPNNNLTSENE